MTHAIYHALEAAEMGTVNIDPDVLTIDGMSGARFRMFLNQLVRDLPYPRLLEVGVYKGSTTCSALSNNRLVATCIDNFSEFGGPRAEFMSNTGKYLNGSELNLVESDFRDVDYGSLIRHDIFMFDGPHGLEDQRDGIILALPALEDRFVLVVDDWNWGRVREGTDRAIYEAKLRLRSRVEIRTTWNGAHPPFERSFGGSDWHNGYMIASCEKA